MVARVFIALLGALIVTAGLLFAMDSVTTVFRERDTARYFRITDVLRRPDSGRPERPAPAQRQPDSPAPEVTLPSNSIEIELPSGFDPAAVAPGPRFESDFPDTTAEPTRN